MTFYQELQLNQAGSKNLLKKSETVKEKSYHILVYLVKIAVTTVSYTHLDVYKRQALQSDAVSDMMVQGTRISSDQPNEKR